ncbi:hypothetical protein V500_06561 [Pseudogymnoascus sp. VKM F-4518 (FW-2643)]|nr:hypothetical protein V500_06561 [Pseudogymnoascus sp. VKM F-4518 (FW-2643)]
MTEPIHTGHYFTAIRHSDTYATVDSSKLNLGGKYILITGASKGIGFATALSFAKAGCAGLALGARSDLSSLSKEIRDAASAAGHATPQILSLELDVTSEASVAAAAVAIAQSFPRLDILINNAGYLEKRAKIAESDAGEWVFLPLLLRNKDSARIIVNISSLGAHLLSPGASAYMSSKLAGLRFTEFIDAEYRAEGILAFAVHPGGVLTDMGRKLPIERQGFLTETPELVADTIVFLTEQRREWLAGRYVAVTWDMEEFLSKKDEIVKMDKLKVRMIV